MDSSFKVLRKGMGRVCCPECCNSGYIEKELLEESLEGSATYKFVCGDCLCAWIIHLPATETTFDG